MSLKSASSEEDSLDCIGVIIRKLRGDDPNAQEKINKGEPDEMVRNNIYLNILYIDYRIYTFDKIVELLGYHLLLFHKF